MSVLKIERSTHGGVRFSLTGRVEAAHVAELQRLIDGEAAGLPIVLDLDDVKLVDRDVVRFFVRCEANGIGLVHCPAYVREWMRHALDDADNEH